MVITCFGYDLNYFLYLIFKFWKYLWELQGGMCLYDYLIVFIFFAKNKRRESQGVPPTSYYLLKDPYYYYY